MAEPHNKRLNCNSFPEAAKKNERDAVFTVSDNSNGTVAFYKLIEMKLSFNKRSVLKTALQRIIAFPAAVCNL